MKTPTLALTRQLNRLNGTTLSTWLTLRGAAHACLQDPTKVRTCTASIFPCSQVRCTQAQAHKQATCQPSLCARPSNSPALTKLGVMGLLGTWEKMQKAWLMGNPVSHRRFKSYGTRCVGGFCRNQGPQLA